MLPSAFNSLISAPFSSSVRHSYAPSVSAEDGGFVLGFLASNASFCGRSLLGTTLMTQSLKRLGLESSAMVAVIRNKIDRYCGC